MTLRPSMADMIAKLRLEVADPAGASQRFSDHDLQDKLDEHRIVVRYELLRGAPDIQPPAGGNGISLVWARYLSRFGYWETDAVLQGYPNYTVLTPVTSDFFTGQWTFAQELPAVVSPPGQFPPVWATGKAYDFYRAVVAVLDLKIASYATTAYDFSSDGQSFHRGTIIKTLQAMRTKAASKCRAKSYKAMRSDFASAYAPGLYPTVNYGTSSEES